VNNPADEVMNPNADSALNHSYALVLILAGIAGAMDALDFSGVWSFLPPTKRAILYLFGSAYKKNPGEATLSLFSLAGCAVGVTIVIVLRF